MKYKTVYGFCTTVRIKSGTEEYFLREITSFSGKGYFLLKNTYAGGWELIRIVSLNSDSNVELTEGC